MSSLILGCDYCDAVVTLEPSPDFPGLLHAKVAHDDDCTAYQNMTNKEVRK